MLSRVFGGVVIAVIVLCCVAPLLWIVIAIASSPEARSEFRLDRFRIDLIGRTVLYNFSAGLVATLLAVPAALVIGRGRAWIAGAIAFVLPIGLLIPSITYAYGWTQFFLLIDVVMVPASLADVARCVWSLATWLWPIPAAAMGLALRRTDSNLQQQALLDGGLFRVTTRQLLGPAIVGTACAAALAMQEFAIYEPSGISVVATEVRMVFDTGAISSITNPIAAPMAGEGAWMSPDQASRSAAAAVTSLPMIVIVLLLAGLALLGARRMAVSDEVETGRWPACLNAGWLAGVLAVVVIVVTLGVPIVSMVLSLRRKIDPLFIWSQFSPNVTGSSMIAAMAGGLAMLVALRGSTRLMRGAMVAAVLSFLVGGQLLAIAQIRIYNRASMGWIYDNFPIVVMTHFARFGWIALLAAAATWSRPWRSLRDLAAVDGADGWQTATKIVWPLAWPMLAAASLIVASLSLTEVPATVLITPQKPEMLTPMLMSWVHIQRFDAMIEGSLLMVLLVFVIGGVSTVLLVIGIRIFASLRRRRGVIVVVLLCYMLQGCGDPAKPKAIWCETGNGPGQVVYPRAISYSPTDNTFFVVDRMARVQHLDDRGKCLKDWRMPDWQMGKPVGLSVGPDGNLYVPDTHYQRVMVYKPDGTLVRQWGGPGKGPGEFIFPTDVAFDSAGRVFVSEYGDHDRIQVFDMAGTYLYEFGGFGQGDGEFSRPQSMVIDGDLVYVTDACNHRIAVFKTDGTFVRNMGSVGSGLGQFRFPYGLDQDTQGHLIVCEFGNNRVQLIDKETGAGIKVWGVGGREPGELAYPWGVAVDKKGRVVAVDAGNNRLQVFSF